MQSRSQERLFLFPQTKQWGSISGAASFPVGTSFPPANLDFSLGLKPNYIVLDRLCSGCQTSFHKQTMNL